MLCRSSLVNTTSRWRIKEFQESQGDFFGAGERWSAMVGGALLFPKFGHSLAGGHFRTRLKAVIPRHADSLFQILLCGKRLLLRMLFP